MARWLAATSDLAGVVIIEETADDVRRRIKREMRRVGLLRLADVMAFRLYYKTMLASADAKWERETLDHLRARFPAEVAVPICRATSPNSSVVEDFIIKAAPDVVIARSKHLMKERIFTLPQSGTLVMHPGICPEYRNAHGCFWALANDDLDHVGVTLLAIDKGIDTGPIYGYYSYALDEVSESHARIQSRCVLDNLDAIATRLAEIARGEARPMDTTGRASAVWGQPWLSKHLLWKWKARRRARRAAIGNTA